MAGLRNLFIQAESSYADTNAVAPFSNHFQQVVKDGGYHSHQVFKADKTGMEIYPEKIICFETQKIKSKSNTFIVL